MQSASLRRFCVLCAFWKWMSTVDWNNSASFFSSLPPPPHPQIKLGGYIVNWSGIMDVLGNGPSELCSGAYIGFLKGGQIFAGHTKGPGPNICFPVFLRWNKTKTKTKKKQILSVDQGGPLFRRGGPRVQSHPGTLGQSAPVGLEMLGYIISKVWLKCLDWRVWETGLFKNIISEFIVTKKMPRSSIICSNFVLIRRWQSS